MRLLIHSAEAKAYDMLLKAYDLPELEVVSCTQPDEARRAVKHCRIVLGEPERVAALLPYAERLEWVQSTFAGIEAFCTEGLRRDYILTGVKDVHAPLMSEYVMAYILCLERHLFETRKNQKAGRWADMPYRSLRGLVFGICGLGSIGRHLAQTARHFGLRVLAFRKTSGQTPEVDQVFTAGDWHEFLGQVDFLVLALPNTPETTGLINRDALAHMKPSAVVINVGRGNAVVEADLADALKTGKIRVAVIDVFDKEPLPADSPLWKIPNLIITPHNSAISFPKDIAPIFHENYLRFLAGKPLKFVVDFDRGY